MSLESLLDFFKKLTKDRLPLIIGGVVVGLLGMWVLLRITNPIIKSACTSILQTDKSGMRRDVKPIQIEGKTVALGTITRRIATVGTLSANASVVIKPEIHGIIKETPFGDGTFVEKGAILIQFEDADAKAELKQAEAELVLRRSNFERSSALHKKQVESSQKYDQAASELGVAEARLEAAKAKLEKCTIKAPFSGIIGIKDVSVGAYVQAGQDLVTLVDLTPIKVDFKVPESYLQDVGVGQVAEIRLDSIKNQMFTAIIEAVEPSIEAQSHSMAIRASVPNEDGILKPGLFANVSVIIGEKNNAILIPESALDREGEIEFVYIVENGKATRRRVLTGTRENAQVEIIAGLKPGQQVVTAGQIKLSEGAPVLIVDPEAKNLAAEQEAEEESKAKPKEEAKKEQPKEQSKEAQKEQPAAESKEKSKEADSQKSNK
jgi:membrane fusion protein (multidrug efflux system)